MSLVLLCCCTIATQAQLLYEVSKDSTSKTSYVMASCRLLNPMGLISQMPELKEAITKTDQMYFEVNKNAYASSIKEAQKLSNGKKLLSLLSEPQQQKLNAFLKKYMEVDFRSSYVQNKYGNLTPAALLEDLEQLLFVANNMGKYDPTNTFDTYFEAQAKVNNESIKGLSDIDTYINDTYKGDLKQQVEKLSNFLENEDTELSKINKGIEAFNAKDLDRLSKNMPHTVSTETLKAWTEKMGQVMTEKPTLFVIDAANMAGTDGLLQQLRNAGYMLKAM